MQSRNCTTAGNEEKRQNIDCVAGLCCGQFEQNPPRCRSFSTIFISRWLRYHFLNSWEGTILFKNRWIGSQLAVLPFSLTLQWCKKVQFPNLAVGHFAGWSQNFPSKENSKIPGCTSNNYSIKTNWILHAFTINTKTFSSRGKSRKASMPSFLQKSAQIILLRGTFVKSCREKSSENRKITGRVPIGTYQKAR